MNEGTIVLASLMGFGLGGLSFVAFLFWLLHVGGYVQFSVWTRPATDDVDVDEESLEESGAEKRNP